MILFNKLNILLLCIFFISSNLNATTNTAINPQTATTISTSRSCDQLLSGKIIDALAKAHIALDEKPQADRELLRPAYDEYFREALERISDKTQMASTEEVLRASVAARIQQMLEEPKRSEGYAPVGEVAEDIKFFEKEEIDDIREALNAYIEQSQNNKRNAEKIIELDNDSAHHFIFEKIVKNTTNEQTILKIIKGFILAHLKGEYLSLLKSTLPNIDKLKANYSLYKMFMAINFSQPWSIAAVKLFLDAGLKISILEALEVPNMTPEIIDLLESSGFYFGPNEFLLALQNDSYSSIVARKIKQYPEWISQEFYGSSALHHAVKASSITIVQLLIEAGANVNNKDSLHDRTPLHYAILYCPKHFKNPQGKQIEAQELIIIKLVNAGAELNIESFDPVDALNTQLLNETGKRQNFLERTIDTVMQSLFDSSDSRDLSKYRGITPFNLAVILGNEHVMILLKGFYTEYGRPLRKSRKTQLNAETVLLFGKLWTLVDIPQMYSVAGKDRTEYIRKIKENLFGSDINIPADPNYTNISYLMNNL